MINNLPNNFNFKAYKLINHDLFYMSNIELKSHFIKYGINENRMYSYNLINNIPDDFNPIIYKKLYNDLINLDGTQLLDHYINYGINEKRQYIETLPLTYILNNDIYDILNDQLTNLFNKYKCSNINDRLKISNNNTIINNHLFENKSILNIKYDNFKNLIFNKNYLNKNLKSNNYDNFNIYHNKNGNLKNHILILNENNIYFDEIILNVHYHIISDTVDYKYKLPLNNFINNINEIEYIIFENSDNLIKNNIFLLELNNYENLLDFLSKKITLLRICIPTFDSLNSRLVEYYSFNNIENDFLWEIKMDKYLCEKFILDNYHIFIYYCYNLIYSVTSRTDLIRHLFLYKYAGLYFDLSVKIINKNFLDLINEFDFITCRDEDYDSLQNGILYIKNKISIISEKMILEILSGVFNKICNENNNKSYIYQQDPICDVFFYGPSSLFKIYIDVRENIKCKLLNTYLSKKEKINDNHYEFEAYSIDKDTNTSYLQVKYIGYNEDIRSNTKNTHYSYNYSIQKYFYSTFNIFDKILIINLEHRKDRKKEMKDELNKFLIENDKIVFIDAIYNKDDRSFGCTLSHLKCIEYAIENNLNNVLILEDDCCFENNIDLINYELLKFIKCNISWDVLLFNLSEHGPPISIKTNINNIYKSLWSQSASAYAINKSFFNKRLHNLIKIIENNSGPHDFYWNENRYNENWFIIKNILSFQRPSYSDIENSNVDYKINYDNIL
jgi:hypothetical protein